MGSFASTELNKMLDALARNIVYQVPAVYVKMHTGDPGAVGTALPFGVTTRMPGTFSIATAGTCANTNIIEWAALASAGTITDVSMWSDVAAGTFLGRDTLDTPGTVNAGDTFRLAVGNLQLALS